MNSIPITPDLLEQKGFPKVPLPGEKIERILRKCFRKDNILIFWQKNFGYSLCIETSPNHYRYPHHKEELKYWHQIEAILEKEFPKRQITKKHNHHHFWIEDGLLFETYSTIR